ncbi:hypothetical protein BDB00DRAFT_45120 [Zychaea mexicana]|uniref:uncharacterized protein n=1 Tax=Zychaea mexicana TaxID=64656 RepID=UPI0022FDF84B|nr:uncharacterized protein BDB00DRAFT_45120 [Zychaea mexicana]KAI9488417.1 hypothetical protein BDB00DRAFT_45120 [Zychaea mexicana]
MFADLLKTTSIESLHLTDSQSLPHWFPFCTRRFAISNRVPRHASSHIRALKQRGLCATFA